MLESSVENPVVRYAEDKGVTSIKLKCPGARGKPDRLFLGEGGKIVFIEFKRPGEKPSKLQRWWHRHLRSLGFDVRVADSKEEGKEIIDEVFG